MAAPDLAAQADAALADRTYLAGAGLTLADAAVFAVLDIFSPSIGVTARQGAGFGIGANLVGFTMR